MTTTVLNEKISEVENQIPDHAKCITTPKFNKLIAEIKKARLKQANLMRKTDFDNKLISSNRKLPKRTKYLEVQKRLNSLKTKDYNFFLTYFTSNDESQNTFVYQPILGSPELKKDQVTDYVFSWKLKGVYTSKHKPLCTDFLHSIRLSGYRMRIKFHKNPLATK